ncbi:phosphotransferase [Kitasatospora sp. NPDC093806]|uniref:phosphotransferase family protein n=1 Tax=Kitasatospora sp. NPDC093806 TaxID=3155075 RepID=UPI00341302F6
MPIADVRSTRAALLRRLLPDDEPGGLVVRQGQFHTVVMGADRVVCLARTRAAAARLPQRAVVLRAVGGLGLGVRTPEPLVEGEGYLVLRRVPGEPLEPGVLDDAEVAGVVAAEYAALLAGLARAGGEEAARAVLPVAPVGQWRRFAGGVRAELFGLMSDSGRRRAERELAGAEALPHLTGAVVHGDLGSENVLWEWTDGRPRLSGVLDWDGVALGDPAEDLAAVAAGHGPEILERVRAVDRWTDPGLTGRIAAIRGTFALQQALAAVRDGDDEELADGLAGYR